MYKPGDQPPMTVVFCAKCDLPVERMRLENLRDLYFVHMEVQCCGIYSAVRVSNLEYRRMKATDEKWYAIVPPGCVPGFRRNIHGPKL